MEIKDIINEALENIRLRSTVYRRVKRYYEGKHNLSFATEKFQNAFGSLFREFALNMCPAICDAVADKLKIVDFGLERAGLDEAGGRLTKDFARADRNKTEIFSGNEAAEKAIRDIWHQNMMSLRSAQVHREALKCGDAFVIVWPDETGRPRIYPNYAENCTVGFDEENAGEIIWAAKIWKTKGGGVRLTIYLKDRIIRLISAKGNALVADAKSFQGINEGPSEMKNPFGRIPVFHFANNAEPGSFGRSELEAAIPIQDGLNKSVLDMLVAMEVCAYRQRWAAGIEIEYDKDGNAVAPFKAGVDHLWITENPDARFGDFAAANLEQFLKVKDGFRIDIASVTGTPLYYLMPQIRGFPSGESLRKAETRFLAKVRARQESFGTVWAEVMSFALEMAGYGKYNLLTRWEEASAEDAQTRLRNIELKKKIGLSAEKVIREAGYPEENN
jgi:hypothetical protein